MNRVAIVGALMVLGMPLAAQQPKSKQVQKVVGIGGLFFRARDPASLVRWYEQHLGIATIPSSGDAQPWRQEAGPTAFAPFPDSTRYFGSRADPEGNPIELWEPRGP